MPHSLPPAAQPTPLVMTRFFRRGGILLVLLFAVVYAFTLDTGLQPYELHGGDLITHQYAQVQARPGNAPGYPVYTMGGWLWFHGWRALLTFFGQPYPNPMPILSSYSTMWALLALWLFYTIVGHLLGKHRQPWVATLFCALLTAFFGVTYFFWYYATTTEQYSSAVAQTLAIFYLYLLWDADPTRRHRLYWLAFLCGLSLAHMLTVALIVPPLVTVILWRDPSLIRSPRAISTSILAAALPLISYSYVYLRGALHPAWWGRGHWDSPQDWFWSFVSTAQGRDELGWAFEPGRPFFGNGFPETMWHELSLPLFTLGLIGIALLPRRHAVLLYSTLALYAIFCWLYRFGNWYQVVLPAYPLILVGIVPWFHRMQGDTTRLRFGQTALFAALALSLIWRIDQSLPAANSRHRVEDTALTRAAILLDQPFPHDARLFAAVDDTLALNYLTRIWGIRPDIKMLNSRDADSDLQNGEDVFATFDATPALISELTLSPMRNGFGPDWIKLENPTSAITASLSATPFYTVTPAVALAAFATQPSPTGAPVLQAPPAGIDVVLTWHLPDGAWPENLAISLRPTYQGAPLLDPTTGNPIQQDRARPLQGLWPDQPSMPVVLHDPYRIALPATLPHRPDGFLLILYTQNASGFTNLAEIKLPLNSQ